jgi:hypothetical protein
MTKKRRAKTGAELTDEIHAKAGAAFWKSVPSLSRMLLESEAAGNTKDVHRVEAFLKRTYRELRDRERFRALIVAGLGEERTARILEG